MAEPHINCPLCGHPVAVEPHDNPTKQWTERQLAFVQQATGTGCSNKAIARALSTTPSAVASVRHRRFSPAAQ